MDSSPRTRRYFRTLRPEGSWSRLFSAHAEVFPPTRVWFPHRSTLLRARGGISHHDHPERPRHHSSPRTRRYFPVRQTHGYLHSLFSAHAEVFPSLVRRGARSPPLLRARGGISLLTRGDDGEGDSSPRTRRYFLRPGASPRRRRLFSAHAEVFPCRTYSTRSSPPLLRARGGISHVIPIEEAARISSPRTWRYFQRGRRRHPSRDLFSAHAEVFPAARHERLHDRPLLRARGGISEPVQAYMRGWCSSPRTRRYFRTRRRQAVPWWLFSAHAEVFPLPLRSTTSTGSLLRARGGISE